MTLFLIFLVAILAFANGSNDNGKGVATLVGFGAAKPAPALLFATLATAVGGIASFFLAAGLLSSFSGGYLFPKGTTLDSGFYVAVLIGACGWILIANLTGMPVSTTHAIIGALCGAGLVAFGFAPLQWAALGKRFALPLALSPILSLVIVYVLAWPIMFFVNRYANRCACIVECAPATLVPQTASPLSPQSSALSTSPSLAIITGTIAECAPQNPLVSASPLPAANALHWFTCGLISFARGWNDTPKIAALCLLALSSLPFGKPLAVAIVTVSMACGGLFMGRRVLATLAKKLTPLPLAPSLTASFVTATLVTLASFISLPVSTTHVATGSIIGAGLQTNARTIRWKKVTEVLLSWLITLPVAALIAALAKWLIK